MDKKMGKRRDQFWDYVVENDAGLQCMFCQFEFSRRTSVSRVKYHLARHEMGSIGICTEVPDDVREAAELAIDGPNKKLKTVRSLSDHQAQNNTIASSSKRQSDGVENPVNGVEREVTGVQGLGHVVEQWRSPFNKDFRQPFARDTNAEGCRNDWEQMIGQLMEPCFVDVRAMESEAVNKNGDFNVDAGSTWFNANDEACNLTIASSSQVQNDGVQNLVNDMEREGGVQESAQVAEEWTNSTSVGVGNHRENVNEALIQPVDMGLSAVGNDALNCNEDFNMTEDWLPPVTNDRLAPDRRMSDVEDIQRMITDLPENMNRGMASQFGGAVMDVDPENDVGTMVWEQAIQPFDRVTTLDEPEPSAHQKTSGDALLTENLTGKTFKENLKNIWDCLMKADVFSIGIYGMGGVGKTSLATHINKQLLETSNPFRFVFWVTVSQDFSIYRLQTLVSKAAKIEVS